MSDLYPHQEAAAQAVVSLIQSKGIAYLTGEPRTGKTRTALTVANRLPVKRVLFITKKMAIAGIEKESHVCTKRLTITNYEQVAKLSKDDFDLIIADEAHNIGRAGKPTQRFKDIRALAFNKPVLLLSGTPWVETVAAAYYQFAISRNSPLPFRTFYDFFREYGIPSQIKVNGRMIETYKKTRPELTTLLQPYCVKITQADAGITAQAEDRVHTVELSDYTQSIISEAIEHSVVTIDGTQYVFDSDSAVRAAVHQLESGAFLYENRIVHTANTEVVDYVLRTFGNSPDVAVMCHYRSTRDKVALHLPKVHLYSSDGHCEGVDLSHYKHFVILNTGYSGARHVQRRDRGTRMDVSAPRLVHHVIAKGHLSEAVYKQVSRKLDFNLQHYRKHVGISNTKANPRLPKKPF